MNLLLLGNGFDLSFILPTKYINYLNTVAFLSQMPIEDIHSVGDVFGNDKLCCADEWISKSYQKYKAVYDSVKIGEEDLLALASISKHNLWVTYLLDSFDKDIGWIDFEKEIATVVHSFQKALDSRGIGNCVNTSVFSKLDEYIIEKFNFFLSNRYSKLLPGAVGRIVSDEFSIEYPKGSGNCIVNDDKIIEKLWNQLNELAESLKTYLKVFVQSTVSNAIAQGVMEPNDALAYSDYIITLNYTRTYEGLYRNNNVFHIHGDVDSRIVLGINPDESDSMQSLNTAFVMFKKYYQRTIYNTDIEYIRWLTEQEVEQSIYYGSDVENDISLVVMGHSLDATDQDIIVELFGMSTDICILYHDESAISAYTKNLIKIFGMQSFLKMRKSKNLRFKMLNEDMDGFIQERAANQFFDEMNK